jgi:outer membrane lipoprotein-sorting protein
MLGLMLAVTLLSSDTVNPIQAAIDYYQGINAYQVTVKSVNGGKTEIMRYSFKKPGHVRMDFETPFKGAVLIYDPAAKNAKLWPFGHHRFPTLTLSPSNSVIQSSTGQRVDRSDVGVLYRNVKTLQEKGKTEIMGMEGIGGRETLHIAVTGGNDSAVGAVARYQLWLDRSNGFPVKVISYDKNGRVIETVDMNELTIDPEFPTGFFTQ